MSGNNFLQGFKNANARNLGFALIQRLGQPNIVYTGHLQWNAKLPRIVKLVLLDENIPHNFPMPHHDFVYSTTNIKVSPDQASALAQVSGSIIIDQLKGQVTARCGALIKNQVTLGFVDDFVNDRIKVGSIEELRNEYARRFKENIVSKSGKYDPIYSVEPSGATQFDESLQGRMASLKQSSGWMSIFHH